MHSICTAVAKSTGTTCQKRTLPGSRYCLFHVDRGPLFLADMVGAVLSLMVSEGYRAIVPSAESQQLAVARRDTSDLRRAFSEQGTRLSSQMEALVKGNESLQRLLDPFRKAATRRFPQMETEAALAKLAQEVDLQRQELDVIRQYTEISKLNFIGTTGIAGHGLKEETGISRVLEGAYTTDNVRSQYSCDSVALAKFQEVIAKFPTFPFSYYALAFCLRQRDDKSWQRYAMKAIEILEKTTRIDGHHRNHEQALREIRAALHS